MDDSSICVVCKGEKVKVIWFRDAFGLGQTHREVWYHPLNSGELVVEGYCTQCGLKYHVEQ